MKMETTSARHARIADEYFASSSDRRPFAANSFDIATGEVTAFDEMQRRAMPRLGLGADWRGFDGYNYAVGPYAEPSLPSDLAAGFASRLVRALGVMARGAIVWPERWMENLFTAHDRRKEQLAFDQMQDHMLKDIGLSRCDLYADLAHRRRKDGF